MKKLLTRNQGFTLIELLIVIVIIGILAGIVIGLTGSNARNKANDAANKADSHEVQNALEQYFVDNDAYPGDIDTLVSGGYLKVAPTLKGNQTLTYTPANSNAEYTLYFPLLNSNDTGPNVVNGNYEVKNKQ